MPERIVEFKPLGESWAPIRTALDEQRLAWKGLSLAALGTVAARFEQAVCTPFEKSFETSTSGQWQASRWVGSFTHAGQSWSIEPRIGWPRFMLMLGDVFSIGVGPAGGVAMANESDLTSLAWLLSFQSAWCRHRGAAKAFVRREADAAPALRGQLDLSSQISKLVDKHTFACRYDELTYDNPINQGTMLAIRFLKQHGRFPFNGVGEHHRITREWQETLLSNGVQTPANFPADIVRWSRSNDGFRAAHRLAELIVGERKASASHGRDLNAFLFDSAEVWELYLYHQLSAALAALGEQFAGFVVHWPRGKRGEPDALLEWQGRKLLFNIPDLNILRPDGTVALVIDAKYRRYRPPTEDPEIVWQMFCYAANANRRDSESWPPTLLLYPRCKNFNNELPCELGRGHFLASGSPLIAQSLDLPEVAGAAEDWHANVRKQLQSLLLQQLAH